MNSQSLPFHLQGAPFLVTDPGSGVAVPVDRWNLEVPLEIGAGAETNSLPAPLGSGWRVRLNVMSIGAGSRVITATAAINKAGNTIMTFNALDEMICLESFHVGAGVYEWRVVANDGVDLS